MPNITEQLSPNLKGARQLENRPSTVNDPQRTAVENFFNALFDCSRIVDRSLSGIPLTNDECMVAIDCLNVGVLSSEPFNASLVQKDPFDYLGNKTEVCSNPISLSEKSADNTGIFLGTVLVISLMLLGLSCCKSADRVRCLRAISSMFLNN